jgi:hypothetical protein
MRSLHADLAVLVHLRLRVEPGDERLRVAHVRIRVHAFAERHHVLDRRRASGGWLSNPIERVDHEHRIPRLGEPLAHGSHRRTEPEDVGPDQDARRRAGRGMHEVRVTGAVRRLDLDIPFPGRLRVGDLRQQHGSAGREQHAELPSSDQPPRLVLRHTLCKVIFVAHIRSSLRTHDTAAPRRRRTSWGFWSSTTCTRHIFAFSMHSWPSSILTSSVICR